MKKKTIAGLITVIAIVTIAMFSGCVEEEATTPTPTPDKERELITQYIMMHEPLTQCTEYENGSCVTGHMLDTEVVIDHLMDYLTQHNLQPVEIYRQSLILYEPSYGYLYPSSYERLFTREHDYNKEYDYPPLCFEDEQKYNLEWIVIGSIRINEPGYDGMSGWSVSGENYASEDINNIRAFIKVTMG